MKKITFLLLNILLCLAISCNSSNSKPQINPQIIAEIEKKVATANSNCPVYLGVGNNVVLECLTYENNVITYNYRIARIDNGIDLKNKELKNSLLYMLRAEAEMSSDNKKFFSNLIEAGSKLVYNYTTPTGESIEIEISNKELKEAFK